MCGSVRSEESEVADIEGLESLSVVFTGPDANKTRNSEYCQIPADEVKKEHAYLQQTSRPYVTTEDLTEENVHDYEDAFKGRFIELKKHDRGFKQKGPAQAVHAVDGSATKKRRLNPPSKTPSLATIYEEPEGADSQESSSDDDMADVAYVATGSWDAPNAAEAPQRAACFRGKRRATLRGFSARGVVLLWLAGRAACNVFA